MRLVAVTSTITHTRRGWLGLLGLCALSACSTPPKRDNAESAHWQGRFAVSYRDPAGETRSTSATFELSGSPSQGTLRLGSPLGTQLAEIRWRPGEAVLQQPDKAETFASLDELLLQSLGAPLPIQALFQWLEGRPTPALGWEADLSQLAQGRLSASQGGPNPITFRLLLSQ